MKVFETDLYEYYKLEKPQGGNGVLHCYILGEYKEINAERKNPAMLVLPGGGYRYACRREAEPVCMKYLSYGFQTFWLDYSVAPVRYPYALAEAVMAMNYIRENADEFHVDENMVSALGFSAGGHLCAMLGSYNGDKDVTEIFKPEKRARPDAIVLAYPVITATGKTHGGSFLNLTGKETGNEKLSIENIVGVHSAPAFIWSTRNDGSVPIRNSLVVAEAYDKAGVPFSLHIYGKGQHGLSVADMTVYGNDEAIVNATKSIPEWVKLSVEWLKENGIELK